MERLGLVLNERELGESVVLFSGLRPWKVGADKKAEAMAEWMDMKWIKDERKLKG